MIFRKHPATGSRAALLSDMVAPHVWASLLLALLNHTPSMSGRAGRFDPTGLFSPVRLFFFSLIDLFDPIIGLFNTW